MIGAVVVAQAQEEAQSSEQDAEEASSGVYSLYQYFHHYHQDLYQSLNQETQPYSSAAQTQTSHLHYSQYSTHSSSSKTRH